MIWLTYIVNFFCFLSSGLYFLQSLEFPAVNISSVSLSLLNHVTLTKVILSLAGFVISWLVFIIIPMEN